MEKERDKIPPYIDAQVEQLQLSLQLRGAVTYLSKYKIFK